MRLRENKILMWRRLQTCLAFGVISGLMITAAQPAMPRSFRLSVEPSYFTGRFGTAHALRIYDLPLAVIYRNARLRVRIEIPYVAVAGAGLLTGGTVLHGHYPSAIRSGLGDIWVSTQYRMIKDAGARPSISPLIKIKIPLASRGKGLGTGQFDAEIGSRFQWRLGKKIFPYAELGYRINGRSQGLKLRNALTYQAGASVALPHRQFATVVFIGHSAFQYHVGPTDSIVAAYNITLNARWCLEAYVDRGLTRNSPAIGGGFGVTAGF